MKPSWIVTGILAALVVAAAPIAFGAWNPMTSSYVSGVDVSAHQGPIDWRTLRASGVRFAYIKATEGGDFVDPLFAQNWTDAARAGIYRGAYHYFTLCRSGASQAAHFLATVPRSAMLPPAVDLEHMGPCRRGPTSEDVPSEIRAFLDRVETATGQRPILYTTRQFHDAHLAEFPREHFWIRSLYTPPAFREREWVFWQHHNGARRPGVAAPIDLDAFRGDEAQLERLASRSGANT